MIQLIQDDITQIKADAIVNAANNSLLGGGGVDKAIHRAGGRAILKECLKIRDRQGGCPTGEAVITTAGNLPARYVIHTVGPVWQGGNSGEKELLYSAYANSLKVAARHQVEFIAFPNISTGVYHFPKQKAAEIAIRAVDDFLYSYPKSMKVLFVCFDSENYGIYDKLLTNPR
jgi:O-acetyl-ADP-ribose deacetylase